MDRYVGVSNVLMSKSVPASMSKKVFSSEMSLYHHHVFSVGSHALHIPPWPDEEFKWS